MVVIAPRSWQDATLGLRGPNGATGEGYGDRIDSLKRRVLSYIGRARGSGQLQSELPKAFGMGATTFFFHLRVLAARQLVHYEPNQAATSENSRAVMTSRWRLMRFVPPELRDAPVAESMILQNMRQIVAHLQALGGMGVVSHIAHVMGMSHAGEMEHKQRRHYMKRFREIKKKLEGAGVVEAFMADKAMAVGGSDQPGEGGDGDAEGNGKSKADTAKKTVLVSCMKLVEPFDEAKLLEAAGVETDDVKDMSACEAGTVPKSFAEISMIEQMMYIIERTGAEGKLQTEIFTDLGISAKKYMGTLEKLGGGHELFTLVNNAGFAADLPWFPSPWPASAASQTLAVNLYGAERLTRVLMPQLLAASDGRVCAPNRAHVLHVGPHLLTLIRALHQDTDWSHDGPEATGCARRRRRLAEDGRLPEGPAREHVQSGFTQHV